MPPERIKESHTITELLSGDYEDKSVNKNLL